MRYASVTVKILGPLMEPQVEQRISQMVDIPPRSRLYGLPPCGVGTLRSESMTSYITRLAWQYRVSPQVFVRQELPSSLAPHQRVPSQGQSGRGFNSNDHLAQNCATTLETLTKRTDIHLLTAQAWIGDFPLRIVLREHPAWCP